METASRSTTTQNETDEDLQDGRMNGWVDGWTGWQIEKQTQQKNK